MCCFSTKTAVHSTRIFARSIAPGKQGLAYQMTYAAETPTAMILPLPVALPASELSVRWIDLKDNASFFQQLAAGFPALPSTSIFRSKGVETAAAVDVIAVHEVGDFVASFVPTMADFARVDPRFSIPKDVWSGIPAYSDYGFAVFQLKELAGAPHPIAFVFDTRETSTLYFPTVHIHDGTVHPQDEFDHVLYAQDAGFDARVSGYGGPTSIDPTTGFVRSKDKAPTFADVPASQGLLARDLLVHKQELTGMLPNKDTLVKLGGPGVATSGCGRCAMAPPASGDTWNAGASVALASLGWIIRRRNIRLAE